MEGKEGKKKGLGGGRGRKLIDGDDVQKRRNS